MGFGANISQASGDFNPFAMIESQGAGVTLFREGEYGDCAYIIESGIVEISICLHGDRYESRLLGPGEIIGEMAIIDGAPRNATATVVADAVLVVVRREQLQDRLRRADPVVQMLICLITSRYRGSVGKAKNRLPVQDAGHDAEPRNGGGSDAISKIRMEAELRNAVETRCLKLVYQPIVDLGTKRVTGFEALARWTHQQHGSISPQVFIGLAEETNLIKAIDEYVFTEAVKGIQQINRALPADNAIFISINVSARQLADMRFLEMASHLTQRTGLDPALVKLEITESQLSTEDNAEIWTKAAKAKGFGVSLDDFGTGFSSLSKLLYLHVDTIKIDQSFVQRLGQTVRGEALMLGIIALARSMNLSVIAEGVESEDQEARLGRLNCGLAQGFRFGKPASLQKILASNFCFA